ncbi:MAG: hypothetical protein IKY94_02770 [Lachnospiraceae bacterium]|nr:hypothetical protein [Lachnospiraceae bacterium]
MNLENKGYMEQGMDLKRLVLVLGKKLWLLLAAAVLGAVLGGFTYKIVTNITNGEPEYRASADYYISFFDDGADYYNAYTWDGILRDDPIVDYALTLLPEEITKDMVKTAVSGEMLGDYRILTVHVNAETKEKADMIAKAYEKSLWHFGQEIELLDEVALWSQDEAVPFEKNTKTLNAAFLGALIALLLSAFVLLFYYVLEDAVYVERDAKERFGLPVYGLLTKNKDELQHQMFVNNMEYVFGDDIIPTWSGEQIPSMKDFEQLRTEERLLVDIPWGRNNCRQIERVLGQLQIQGIKVDGIVITEADDKFVKSYYAVERVRK